MPALADVDYITKGNGWLFINGINVGYLTDGVKIGVKRTVSTYEASVAPGGPLVPIKKVTEKEVVSISAGKAVISAHNLGRALGNKAVVDEAGDDAVAVVDGTNDLRTVQLDRTSGKLFIYLGPGPGLASNFAVTTLKKGSTTLVKFPTADYEYTPDLTTGFVYFESGGTNSIVEGDTIDCYAYTYDLNKGQRIDFGVDSSIKDVIVHFYHKEPNGNVETHAVLWKGACNGDFELDFNTNNWVKLDAVWEGNADSSKVGNPIGYIFQRDLAAA